MRRRHIRPLGIAHARERIEAARDAEALLQVFQQALVSHCQRVERSRLALFCLSSCQTRTKLFCVGICCRPCFSFHVFLLNLCPVMAVRAVSPRRIFFACTRLPTRSHPHPRLIPPAEARCALRAFLRLSLPIFLCLRAILSAALRLLTRTAPRQCFFLHIA